MPGRRISTRCFLKASKDILPGILDLEKFPTLDLNNK